MCIDNGMQPGTESALLQEFGIVSYTMNLSMIEYKTAIIRDELEAAAALLPSIPKACSWPAPPSEHAVQLLWPACHGQ